MYKIMICGLIIIGLQTARAEEVPPPVETTTAQADEGKSFFDTRTLEDFQQMIQRDTASLSADDPSSTGG